uniref:uncharacterized protein LOC107427762 n=1 Tax=Ziziphus jujuba TaxID=326968 RepID=A0A6P4AWL5_ZIZJJ
MNNQSLMDHRDPTLIRPNSPSSSSLKRKLQSSFCCFGKNQPPISSSISNSSSSSSSSSLSTSVVDVSKPRLMRSSTMWMKSRAHDLPELKDKCRSFISRIGRHHSRRHSSDFRYDALSYSLNFDQSHEDDAYLDESPLRSFSSRLPHSPESSNHRKLSSPPPPSAPTTTTEISVS